MKMQLETRSAKRHRALRLMKENKALYLMALPAFAFIVIFNYWPMYGVQIAFRDFNFVDGIVGSKYVGMKWFNYFFRSNQFETVVTNTLALNIYNLIAGFPIPIILALIMNNIPSKRFRRVAQTISYMPHFISVVVLVGMMSCMFSINSGWVNGIIRALGGHPVHLMGEAKYFRHVYVWSGIWQEMGWGSIIYLAALTSIDPGLHEAAMIDGAGKLRRIWHIELPGILPTVAIMLILRFGSMMSSGFDKAYIMQNDMNISVSEVISTYIYDMGMKKYRYSFSAAVGLFNNVINFVLLTVVNKISGKLSGSSLW
ncbi:MAG: sugar ABC transporter permease [Clostridia bacterium]|nr:sugar ABC transporter permease [Clostridiales bacterium]MBQ2977289.1 sugar ABC transporter permease [Clostridia bacterium]MBQ6805165.1 sugar ABC transporter permease [Clostridia bacterium]